MKSRTKTATGKLGPTKIPTPRKPRQRKATLPAESSNPEVVNISVPDSSWTRDRLIAKIAVDGNLANATTVQTYAYGQLHEHGSMQQMVDSLREKVEASKEGSSHLADELLIGQAVALNTVFNEMMRRAAMNIGEYPEAMERYMRLGLKAQSQCRGTLESLSKIKNPASVAFVRQANIANGPQQVNNGTMPESGQTAARTAETASEPIELLEAGNGEWVVSGTAEAAGGCNPTVEAMGASDRAQVVGGKSACQPERLQRRRKNADAGTGQGSP